jgi:nucleoside-diphosphate-sugar epimerase
MMRILVTGARGFVGKHCIEALQSSGVEIHGTTSRAVHDESSTVLWHRCDLLDANETSRLIAELRPTHLLHLAWIATPGVYWTSPLNEVWRVASRQLAECFIAAGGQRLVVTGTCAEYDATNAPCREDHASAQPRTPYAAAKSALQIELAELAESSGLSMAWARLFWMYGPHEHPARLVPSIILSLLRDEAAICTAGMQRRDYLHVGDVSRAIASVACCSIAGPINLASGIAAPIASIATAIAEEMNRVHLLRLGAIETRLDEPPIVVADISRLRDELGFRPSYSLETGLRQTIRWWTEHGSLDREHPQVTLTQRGTSELVSHEADRGHGCPHANR